jgi:chromosome segregation ATPase
MMLDTIFKNGGDRRQVHDELRALVDQARDERAALGVLLTQVGGASAKLARTSQALDALGEKTDAMSQKMDKLAATAASHDKRTKAFDQLEKRVNEMVGQVAEAQRVVQALTAPDGELKQHRQAIDAMSTQARDAQAALGALRQEGAQLDELRTQLRSCGAELGQTIADVGALKSEFSTLRSAESELRRQIEAIQAGAQGARDDAAAATQAVAEVQGKLDGFAQLQALSQGTEKRLAALNALAEHVSHKAKALETQKHTVEHAVIEATRLNEMVWTMDAQIAKLAAGNEQMQRTEEALARLDELAQGTQAQLAAASAARDEFVRESARLETQGLSLSEYLKATVERLSVEKGEVDAFDQRLKSLALAVSESETRVQGVLARDETLTAMQQRSDSLGKAFAILMAEAGDLARKQSDLDALGEQLAQVDVLAKRTAAQHEGLMKSQQEVDAVRGELAEFHKAHAEAMQLRDKLAVDRAALEALGERTASMLGRTPDIEARLDAVLGKMALVDEGGKSAVRLAEVAAELDGQLTRVGARQQFVERLEERINGLHVVTTDVERKLAEQLQRRAEVESLKGLCDTLAMQVVDAQQKLDGVAALQGRLLPVTAQVAALMQTLEKSQQLVQAIKQDETVVQGQQARFAELVAQGQALSAETDERLKQVQAVSDDLSRAAALKEEVLAELAQVQARQRDAVAQTDAAEEQIRRAETVVKQLEQRRTQLLHTEKNIAAFEGRLTDLDRSAEAVDQKIRSLADREALVQAVKTEVENIRQISSRSKADLQFVAEHRSDVSDLRAKVDDLLGRVADTDGKIALIESRRKTVEEVEQRANSITHMLGDINVNLEMLGEQRAVIDHVGEKLARLDFTVQEAQNTLRALQREREVAERIEQGIKALRTRTA